MVLRFTVTGEPRTKKNSLKIVGTGRRCPFCKKPNKQWISQGDAYKAYAEAAARQIRPRPEHPIDYPVNIKYLFFMKTRRQVDALNLAEAMDDILQDCQVILNDCSSIVYGHDGTRVLYDKINPRTEIVITSVEVSEDAL